MKRKRRKKRGWKILSSWIIFSLLFQFAFYFILNKKVETILAPTGTVEKLIEMEAEIPGISLENIKISHNKDYLAYKENGVLKVFNLQQNKVVFEKKPPSNNNDMGVFYYQWLPDRDTLVYFYARKNPNAVVTVEVPIEDNDQDSNNQAQGHEQQGELEDPNQSPNTNGQSNTNSAAQNTKPKTRKEVRYNNPQITELYSLDLPAADDTEAEPEDRYNRNIDGFPAGGKISQMVVSTFTNLLYLTIETNTTQILMEIDIMKNVRTLNNTGEKISHMAASDKFGTLYFKSSTGIAEKIIALHGNKREVISEDPNEVILGNRAGTLYLGELQGDRLISIRSGQDASEDKKISFKTIWEGSIPFGNIKGTIIGLNNKIIVYNNNLAYIIENGEVTEISLPGQENIISPDGIGLIELAREGTFTKVKVQSLSQLVEK